VRILQHGALGDSGEEKEKLRRILQLIRGASEKNFGRQLKKKN